MTAIYYSEPNKINFMQLPDGKADVWLRTEITETKDEEGNTCWECEEISFRTTLSLEEIEANFDALLANGGPVVDEETREETADGITLKERVEICEEAITEMGAIIAELME